jgi:hypothetical protein
MGTIVQINGSDVIIKYRDVANPLKVNQVLHIVLLENKSVILKVTYPMQTSAKCRIISGNIQDIHKSMLVYDGDKVVAVKTDVPVTEHNLIDTYEYKVNPANGHKYFVTEKVTWDEAEKEAVAAGGHLVTIRNSSEEEWIRQNFGDKEYFWIGFMKTAWSYKWISMEAVTYSNWFPGEPNNWKGIEDVVTMNYVYRNNQSDFGSFWNDTDRNDQHRGIAEIIN